MSEPRQLTDTVKIRLLEHILSATEHGPVAPTWEDVREIALRVAEIAVRLSSTESDRGRKEERERMQRILREMSVEDYFPNLVRRIAERTEP